MKAFKDKKCWTEVCTKALQSSPRLLFSYDLLEFACSVAFGEDPMQRTVRCTKIMINPIMMICYHPTCLNSKKRFITLKHPCNVTPYTNFQAVSIDILIEKEEYDAICDSPINLLKPGPLISVQTRDLMKKFAIYYPRFISVLCFSLEKYLA